MMDRYISARISTGVGTAASPSSRGTSAFSSIPLGKYFVWAWVPWIIILSILTLGGTRSHQSVLMNIMPLWPTSMFPLSTACPPRANQAATQGLQLRIFQYSHYLEPWLCMSCFVLFPFYPYPVLHSNITILGRLENRGMERPYWQFQSQANSGAELPVRLGYSFPP